MFGKHPKVQTVPLAQISHPLLKQFTAFKKHQEIMENFSLQQQRQQLVRGNAVAQKRPISAKINFEPRSELPKLTLGQILLIQRDLALDKKEKIENCHKPQLKFRHSKI